MKEIDKVYVGKRIQQQRELLGYTREELAEKEDITPHLCYDLELGQKGMSVDTLCKLKSAHVSYTHLPMVQNQKKRTGYPAASYRFRPVC